MPEGAYVIIVLLRVEPPLLHLLTQQGVVMNALAAGGHLEAAPQQVKAARGLRVILAEGGIHRALGERKAHDVEKIRAVLLLGPGAEQPLALRVEVPPLAATMALRGKLLPALRSE